MNWELSIPCYRMYIEGIWDVLNILEVTEIPDPVVKMIEGALRDIGREAYVEGQESTKA